MEDKVKFKVDVFCIILKEKTKKEGDKLKSDTGKNPRAGTEHRIKSAELQKNENFE